MKDGNHGIKILKEIIMKNIFLVKQAILLKKLFSFDKHVEKSHGLSKNDDNLYLSQRFDSKLNVLKF